MRRSPVILFIAIILLIATAGLVTIAQRAAPSPRRPGVFGTITQLPNGWRLAPAGRHAWVGDLPLNMVWSPDGRYLIVTNNGWLKPTLTIFDTANFYIKSVVPLEHAWLGLAQNGPDHVDAHRSILLAVSPFAKRQAVDSTLYTTSGVLRTMELILGMEPMTQYDAATPMHNAFQPRAVLTPFKALPARVPLDERNRPGAWGAEASARMNLEEADMAPELELNEIIWRSIRGAHSPMPPPRRAAFIRSTESEEEDENKKEGSPRTPRPPR
ncbi:MAG: hypothetical protein A3G21_18510 [Acidobacteria bacterium RIFCSPLOWO2_12_FULL_66_21]|nr:MAG: hypothetical protein A3G21_18510 [Acidobacteria bacterium RIFCSPLOWO2_12_FULL_66_21]